MLVPVMTAPNVPPSTISIADGFRTAMTLEPSIVAPSAMRDHADDEADY